jgi:sortase A
MRRDGTTPERKQTAAVGFLSKATASGEYKVTRTTKSGVFIHRAETENILGNSSNVDDPLINSHLDAVLLPTQTWNPGGTDGTSNNRPVDGSYDTSRKQWAIHNEDRSGMPDRAAFNAAVSEGAQTTRADAASRGTSSDPEDVNGTKPGTSTDTEVVGANAERIPEYRSFYSEGDPETPAKLISSDSSVGEIPAVKPFNFGRDPGGPEDKTLYLTIPELGLTDVPVFDTVSEEKLREGTVHIPATGYPWQDGANVYIAGHRVGYANTASYYVFFRLDELVNGDGMLLEDSAGGQYHYRVTRRAVVGADSVEVMNPVEGESLVTLQTCTLPDYEKRLIVQAELVEKNA